MDETTYRNPAADHTAEGPPQVSVLSSELSNRIAAGEVVERPASVVKELVENSLDAGAGSLDIRIEAGGRDVVEIVDDGCGMEREDLLRAIERHATSKIDGPEDLDRIGTLGFRGEALPSIGAVSRMEIRSKPHGAVAGTRVLVEGGEVKEVADAGLPAGTLVRVEDLFFNTPARRKFMKSKRAESRRITEMLTRMSLSRPDVRFLLERDGTVRLDLASTDDLLDRVRELMGRDVAEAMYPTYEYPAIDGVVARGYFSEPSHDQRSSTNIYTYVNGRYVEDATIRAAIQKAYGELLDSGRYPSVVLFVDVPFELVDVNVHPMKTEVRFDDTQPVFRSVYHAIGDALAEAPWVEDDQARRYELEEAESEESGEEGGAGDETVDPSMAEFEPLSARNRRRSQQSDGPSGGAGGGDVDSPFYDRRRTTEDDGQQGFDARGAEPLG
ncbi:MAG: DNA mismatch repair endonuclease MutL, partial [Bradymonadaceae bacterium]